MNFKSTVFKSTLALSIVFFSCNNSSTNENASQADSVAMQDTTPAGELATYHFTYTIGNIAALSPMQVLDEFSKSNLPVDASLCNPSDNAGNYRTTLKQAFNYGIYGVDLGYLVVSNRTLDVITYYGVTKKLAEELNMSETFNRFVDRFEANKDNKDTLTRVVDEAFAASDAFLRSNERLETASQVLAGSWLECQYLTVGLLQNAERNASTEILFQRVWEQRLYLENIAKLLSEFKDNAELTQIKTGYEGLLAIYKEPADANAVNKEYLQKLFKALGDVRAGIIK